MLSGNRSLQLHRSLLDPGKDLLALLSLAFRADDDRVIITYVEVNNAKGTEM